jgi:hypothetical protein
MCLNKKRKKTDDRVGQTRDSFVYRAGRIKKDHQTLPRYIMEKERNKSILCLSMFPIHIYT